MTSLSALVGVVSVYVMVHMPTLRESHCAERANKPSYFEMDCVNVSFKASAAVPFVAVTTHYQL